MIDLPLNAEFIRQVAVGFAPECFLKLHAYLSAFLKLVEDGCQFIDICVNNGKSDIIASLERHARAYVRKHHDGSLDVQSCVHDQIIGLLRKRVGWI